MKNYLLAIITLCLSIIACTKRQQVSPTPSAQEIIQPIGLKGQNHIVPGVDQYRLLVKFKATEMLGLEKSKPIFSNQGASVRAKLWGSRKRDLYSFTYEHVIPFEPEEKAAMLQGRTAPVGPGQFNRYAFRGMLYVREATTMPATAVLELANEFEKLDIVEYAAMEPVKPPPPPSISDFAGIAVIKPAPLATPDFTEMQYYKNDVNADTVGPDVRGINMEYAWSIGVTGAGIRIADMEFGFNKNHEDLMSTPCQYLGPPPGDGIESAKEHGTAVLGVLMAQKNTFGITGMVHGADVGYFISEMTHTRPAGIALGLQQLRRGDVFLYEMQTSSASNELVPADYNQAVWDITKTATDSGIIVVAAAGNGNANLDGSSYNSYRARGDNGAIIVGGGTIERRNRFYSSTYGSPVHVQGWGRGVVTLGYGNLYDDGVYARYIANFNGTSAASAVVTCAVVAIQSWYKARNGTVLAPRAMRGLLINTGIPQGNGTGSGTDTGHIGPLPNIKAAIESLN
jgi:subtilisin family serine protease